MYVTVYMHNIMYTVPGLGTCLQVVTVIVLECRPVTDMQQSRVTEDDDETPEDGDAVSDDEEDEED
jgi:hypothetical protein